MKILSSKVHGIIDYILVLFLATSPYLFKMESPLCIITYSLACVHFLLTILTNFEPGILKLIPFRVHGFIELIVAIGLGSLSLWFREKGNGLGFYYFAGLAVAILIVFNLTDFKGARKSI
jgi:hypothetical protein